MCFRRLTACLAFFFLTSCTTTTPISGSVIDETYSVGGYTWTSGTQVYVFYKLFESGNSVAICGAWAASGASAISNADVAVGLEVGVLYLGSSRIKQGISFMRSIGSPKNANGKPAICRKTSVEWRTEFGSADPLLRFPSMSFS